MNDDDTQVNTQDVDGGEEEEEDPGVSWWTLFDHVPTPRELLGVLVEGQYAGQMLLIICGSRIGVVPDRYVPSLHTVGDLLIAYLFRPIFSQFTDSI